LLGVFADEGLGVVAGDVVPLDAVLIDIVEESHAGFHTAVDVKLSVVRLANILAL